jgi:hypothetical protein
MSANHTRIRGIHRYPVVPIELVIFADWFLPSKDELITMYDELHLNSIGNFSLGNYWTSSEYDLNRTWSIYFHLHGEAAFAKTNTFYVRACRAFTSATVYSLRDIGPAGGYIFWKSGNDYLEAAPSNCNPSTWSNITGIAVTGTGTAIGTGQANTTAIINQALHTTSAAKLCDDLIL